MNIEDLSAEEIFQRVNLQGFLNDLQAHDREKIKRGIGSLAAVSTLGIRKDSLYALAGYYALEVHTLEEIEFFFNAIRPLLSVDLGFLMLRDLARSKEAFRQRTLMDDLSKYIGRISKDADPVQRNQFIELVETAEWGEKLKDKFLEQID